MISFYLLFFRLNNCNALKNHYYNINKIKYVRNCHLEILNSLEN